MCDQSHISFNRGNSMGISKQPRLLCVDDNSLLLRTLAEGFKLYGFEVITALNGVAAVEQFQAHAANVAVIITDHEMPGMNGAELIKRLRALGYRGQVLVMSGRLTASDSWLYEDCAVTGFLQKPFEVGMVATMLKENY